MTMVKRLLGQLRPVMRAAAVPSLCLVVSCSTAPTGMPGQPTQSAQRTTVPVAENTAVPVAASETTILEPLFRAVLDDVPASPYSGVLSFSADGQQLIGVSPETTRIWQISDGLEQQRHQNALAESRFWLSPEGAILAVEPPERTEVRLWRTVDDKLVQTLRGHEGRVGRVVFSADGTLVATAAIEGPVIRIWRVADGALLSTLDVQSPMDMSFSPDNTFFAVAGGAPYNVTPRPDGSSSADEEPLFAAQVFRVADGSLVQTYPDHSWWVEFVSISPDQTLLASGSVEGDRSLRIWNLADGGLRQLYLPADRQNGVIAAEFSPDNRNLTSISGADPWVTTHRVSDGSLVSEIDVSTADNKNRYVPRFRYSPDGDQILVRLLDWDDEDYRAYQLFLTADGRAADLLDGALDATFSHDGSLLAALFADGTVQVWRVRE